MTRRRRTTRIIRLVALAGIVVGPILRAHFQTRPLRTETVDASAYIAARAPLIDRLLPAGAGGTHFVASLGGPAGVTLPGSASIQLLVPRNPVTGAMVELHERAHLLESLEWRTAAKIIAQLPAPVAGSYAATSATEHFAEMAASAWSLMRMFDSTCIIDIDNLVAEAEHEVPGTSGFLARFLAIAPLEDTTASNALNSAARRISAPQTAAWDSLWNAVDARRRPDGTFEAWPRMKAREFIESQRAAWRGRGVAGSAMRLLLWPGAKTAAVLGA